MQQIFVSSLPHVIASTVLILLLLLMAVAAHFRPRKGDQFNLTNVAAALADSNLPELVKNAKVDIATGGTYSGRHRGWLGNINVGQEVARKLGNWKVYLMPSVKAGGLETLHISRK